VQNCDNYFSTHTQLLFMRLYCIVTTTAAYTTSCSGAFQYAQILAQHP
jgi:hypothetical protein